MTAQTNGQPGTCVNVGGLARPFTAALSSLLLVTASLGGVVGFVTVANAPEAAAATSNDYCGGVGTWNGSQCVYTSQSNGSWTKPAWLTTYRIDLVGGGGGGYNLLSSSTGRDQLWGLAGGAGTLSSNAGATASTVTFTIGTGGARGGSNNAPGAAGGTSTATGVSDASGGAGGFNYFGCTPPPGYSWPASQQSNPGPLSGYTNYGASGAGSTQDSDGGAGANCLSGFPPGFVTAGSGQAGGIVITFDRAPTPSDPSSVVATANASDASFSVSFTASGSLGGLTPTYGVTCTSSDGGATVSASGGSSPVTVTGPATRGKNYVCAVQTSTLGGTSNSASSSSVLMAGPPQNTVVPSFTGTPAFKSPAEVLTGNAGTWDEFGIPGATYAYLWQSQTNCTGTWGDAAGSTKTQLNYTIVSGDVGNCLRLQVTGTNVYGSNSAISSSSLLVTTAPAFTVASPPVIADVGYAFNGVAGGYQFQASGGRISYSLSPATYNAAANPTGLPATLTINASTGALSGTPTGGQGGVYTYRVVATNDSGTATTATLTLTISDGTPALITITTQPAGGMASGTTLTTQPVVQLKDSSGRLIAQPLAITATSSGGSTLGGTTAVTTSGGTATYTNLTLAGLVSTNYTLTFARGGVTATSSPIQVTPGALASISITTQPVAAAAAGDVLATQPVVTLLDAQSNVINDRSSTVTVTSELAAGGAGGSVGGTTSLATLTGIATFTNLTFGGTVGTAYKLKFTSGAVTALSANISNTAAGAPTQVSIQTQPSLNGTQLVGSAFTTQPVVRILDLGGNLTTSTANVTATASGGTLGGTATIAAASGSATFTGLTFAGLIGTNYTLTFTSPGLTSATSATFQFANSSQRGPVSTSVTTITASPATRPADGASTSTITVQAKDAGGNNLSTSQGVVTLASTLGTLGSVTDNTNGTYTATYTAPTSRGTGSSTISGTLAGSALTQTASIGLFTTQTITFAQPADVPLGTLPYQLSASASSGLAVAFSLGSGTTNSACTVSSGGIVTINAVGNCQIQVDQAGDSVFWPATQVVRTYAVTATTPTAPYITSVTEGASSGSVAFVAPGFDGGAAISNYEYSLDAGSSWTALSPADFTSPVTVPGLTNGTSYRVTLRAVNIAGAGLASNTSPAFVAGGSGTVTSATTTPSAPRNAQVTAEPSTTATVAWQEPQSDGGSTITSYTVTMSPAGTCTASIAATSRNGSCTVSGLTPGVTYTFTIRAVNANGAGAAATVRYTVPSTPVSAAGLPQVTLTFDPRGGSCSATSISGTQGAWVSLVSASQCQRKDHLLVGWQPRWSSTVYAAGSGVQLIEDNTLLAVWHFDGQDTSGARTPNTRVKLVIWNRGGTNLAVGKPEDLRGKRSAVSIVTTDPDLVTPRMVAVAKRVAARHGGSYVGVVEGEWWRKPRVVAAYRS